MIEAYAFLAMFLVQILAMSVLYPSWFIRYSRRQAASIPPERLAQLYPGVDLDLARERFLTRYRTLNIVIAVLGLLLLGWLFTYLQRPDWDDGPVVIMLVTAYFLIQSVVPMGVLVWHGVTFNRAHKRSLLDSKRKADLHRRRLFDFISPFVVGLAIASYLLFAALVIYLQPFAGIPGLVSLGAVSLAYALNAFVVYKTLYGRKPNPFETNERRTHTIGLVVKSSVYSCLACAVFLALNFTLALLELQRWEPFALSVFFVITAFLSLMGMIAPPREPEAGLVHTRT
jgi:hypothetical protein